jgi:hypothetical protein
LAGAAFVAGAAAGFFDGSCAPALSGIAAASNKAENAAKYAACFIIVHPPPPLHERPSLDLINARGLQTRRSIRRL